MYLKMEDLDFKEFQNTIKQKRQNKREIVQNWILKNE